VRAIPFAVETFIAVAIGAVAFAIGIGA